MPEQTATFVLKLRRNIALEGDLALAERELAAYFGRAAERVEEGGALRHNGARPGGHLQDTETRQAGTRGYRADGPLALLGDLVRAGTFYTRIHAVTADTPEAREWLAVVGRDCGPVLAWEASGERLAIEAIPHNLLFELSGVVVRRAKSVDDVRYLLGGMLDALLGRPADRRCLDLAGEALAAHQTTSHLFHDLHYYKAKFFPRMVRSVLGTYARRLGPGPHRVLDPFAGSGTTLLEASLLGHDSAGLDLDPLSVSIAQAKLRGLGASGAEVAAVAGQALEALDAVERAEGTPPRGRALIEFPAWLTRNRRFTPDVAEMLTAEIHQVRAVLDTCEQDWLAFFRVLVSDAISRRIRMRLLGTGVGRFSLTFSTATLPQMVRKAIGRAPRIAAAAEWMRDTLGVRLAPADAREGDARRLGDALRGSGTQGTGEREGPAGFDLLVTSPPYLPASSGRETYSKARVLSFLALDMLERDGIDLLVGDAIGSMDGDALDPDSLAPAEADLVAWLQADDLRAIKALPTARYFQDMRETFRQMRQVLEPGAAAVVVSGRQSTFYQFATRESLYVAESARLLAAGARDAGFEVEEMLDIQLAKSNMNARPRALDDYYETLIVLRQPRRVTGAPDRARDRVHSTPAGAIGQETSRL